MINVVYGNHELHAKLILTGDGNADQLDIQPQELDGLIINLMARYQYL